MDSRERYEGGDTLAMEDIAGPRPSGKDPKGDERLKWGRKVDYILSTVGFCVGLGNLWRFPYICNRNGGGAFLIPFLFFIVVCGLPMFFLETALGQFSGKGVIHIWDICPLFRGVGYGMAIVSSMMCIYYNIILAWCIYYIVMTFASVLPWTTCGHWWSTDQCVTDLSNVTDVLTANHTPWQNVSTDRDIFAHSSVEEFWQYA